VTEQNEKNFKAFDVLWLTARFQKNLDKYLRGKSIKLVNINRTFDAFYEDPTTLDRTPIKKNKRLNLFHTSISDGDRLVDLPHTSKSRYGTLLLNIGDHTINEWAEGFRCDSDEEIKKSKFEAKEADLNKAGVQNDLILTVLASSREPVFGSEPI
jgi:hypothetical protein